MATRNLGTVPGRKNFSMPSSDPDVGALTFNDILEIAKTAAIRHQSQRGTPPSSSHTSSCAGLKDDRALTRGIARDCALRVTDAVPATCDSHCNINDVCNRSVLLGCHDGSQSTLEVDPVASCHLRQRQQQRALQTINYLLQASSEQDNSRSAEIRAHKTHRAEIRPCVLRRAEIGSRNLQRTEIRSCEPRQAEIRSRDLRRAEKRSRYSVLFWFIFAMVISTIFYILISLILMVELK
jgi:hypothetical protein